MGALKFKSPDAALTHWRKWLAKKSVKDLSQIMFAARAWFETDEIAERQTKKAIIDFVMGFDPIATPSGLLQFLATLDHCPGCGAWMARGDLAIEECLCDLCAEADE